MPVYTRVFRETMSVCVFRGYLFLNQKKLRKEGNAQDSKELSSS